MYVYYFAEIHYLEVDENLVFSYASYESIIANVAYLNSTIFSYSIATAFDNQTSFNSCAVVFVDNIGNLIATTKLLMRYTYNHIKYYPLPVCCLAVFMMIFNRLNYL